MSSCTFVDMVLPPTTSTQHACDGKQMLLNAMISSRECVSRFAGLCSVTKQKKHDRLEMKDKRA